MKRIHNIAALLLLLAVPLAQAMEPAPTFTLAGVEGEVSLASQQGKVVYLDFWASWCTPCRQSFPWMNELQARYGDKGLKIIAINLDKSLEESQPFIDATHPAFTIAFDPQGKIAEQYRVMGMPSSYLIDRKGQLHSSHIGFRDKDKAALEQQIEELLQQ